MGLNCNNCPDACKCCDCKGYTRCSGCEHNDEFILNDSWIKYCPLNGEKVISDINNKDN